MTAYDLFRTGLDTLQIAETLGVHEAEVIKLIDGGRNAKRNIEERKKRGAL